MRRPGENDSTYISMDEFFDRKRTQAWEAGVLATLNAIQNQTVWYILHSSLH
jgi:hypothetical protein